MKYGSFIYTNLLSQMLTRRLSQGERKYDLSMYTYEQFCETIE